jgi:hypothetical protein
MYIISPPPSKTSCNPTRKHMCLDIYVFYYYNWVNTSAGGVIVLEGIIHTVVSPLSLTWFIRYILFEIYSAEII